VTVYYVIGGVLVVWALVLTAMGVTRASFPPARGGGRALMLVSAAMCLGALVALLVTTEKEHPREEAAAEAAEGAVSSDEGTQAPGGEAGGHEAGAKQAQGGRIAVIEDEYSIELPDGNRVEAGPYALEAVNDGKIPHDLAVEGPGVRQKTPTFESGKTQRLEVELAAGTYKVYCSVPGHEEQGMRTELRAE
jgi:plastocyanin